MNIPLPKVVADVEAGGPFVTSARGLNALRQSQLQNQISGIEAQYKPLTVQAEAASKLAYANLMGPQFLAKMMANDPILANMTEEQKRTALQKLYQAGSGQGTGASIFGNLSKMGQPSNNNSSLAGNIVGGAAGMAMPVINKLLERLGITSPSANPMANPTGTPPSSQNAMVNMPNVGAGIQATPQQANAISGMQPGQAMRVDESGNLVPVRPNTFAENTAKQKSIVEEGAELGRGRAKDINSYGNIYQAAVNQGHVFDDLVDMSNSPEMQKLKNGVPLFQEKQMKVLSKIGTPEEQEMVGRFYNSTNELIKNTINSFEGNKLRGEADIARDMKVSPNDTWSTMVGKLQSAMTYNEYNKQLSSMVVKLMKDQHLDKQTSIETADKALDGKKIRTDIFNQLHPKPTDADIKYMADKYKISEDEVRKRLKAKGH